jgi:hypothetical protein
LCLDEDSHIVAEDITFTCQDVDYCEDYEYRCERLAMPMILYGVFCHINLGLDPDLGTAWIRILQHSDVHLNDFSLPDPTFFHPVFESRIRAVSILDPHQKI